MTIDLSKTRIFLRPGYTDLRNGPAPPITRKRFWKGINAICKPTGIKDMIQR